MGIEIELYAETRSYTVNVGFHEAHKQAEKLLKDQIGIDGKKWKVQLIQELKQNEKCTIVLEWYK